MDFIDLILILVYKLLLLITVSDNVVSLRLISLSIPSHIALGNRASLSCEWQLSSVDRLYSVKWYKDGMEFFRYVPKDEETKRQYPQPGVHVENADEMGSNLTLSPATFNTGGRYRCEVSGERPLFPTVSDHGDMMVVALPQDGPIITGTRSRYSVGERIHARCISGKSQPAAKLTWYINGEPAASDIVHGPKLRVHADGLESTELEIELKLKPKHFKKGDLKIKCLATIAAVYWKSNEESVQGVRRREHTRELEERADQLHASTKHTEDTTSNGSTFSHESLTTTFYIVLLFLSVMR